MNRVIILILCILCLEKMQINAQLSERIYLQTDKQCYFAGEMLWMKLYTTDTEGKLMDFSKIGYIELIRDSIPDIQIKVDIRNGTGTGWMELPALLPTGYYRMIAYTRYMRNEGENVFFEKLVGIINPYLQKDPFDTEEAHTSLSIKPIEQHSSQFDITIDKSVYTKRNNGEIRIKGLPAENISMGLSITGIEPFLEENTTIVDWKKQLSAGQHPAFANKRLLPEYEGAIIDGVIINRETGNPATAVSQAITLLSFPGKDIQLFAGQSGENGHVAFYTSCTTGKEELTTTAIDPSGGQYRVDIQSPYTTHTHKQLPVFNPDSTWIDYLQDRNLTVQVSHAYTVGSLSDINEMVPCSYLRPYIRYILDEYTRFPNMEEVFIEFIKFVRISRTNEGRRFSMMTENLDTYTNNVLVLLDNIPIANHELMCGYNPLQIKTIDIHIGNYIFGEHFFNGLIAFFSYKNDFPGITFGANTQLFDYEGTQPNRYFYTPRYDDLNVSSRMPDFRHTLLWEPTIQSNGQPEVIIPFTTSDLPGRYLITVEGIGLNGSVVRATQVIEVKEY